MDEVLQQFIDLYNKAPKVGDLKPQPSEEYTLFMQKKGLPVAVFSVKKHLSLLPSYDFYQFYNDAQLIWLIPCDLPDGSIFGFVLRAWGNRSYRIYEVKAQQKIQALFGWATFGPYNGEWLVLTEGTKDVCAVQTVYPYVLGACTSGVGKTTLDILCSVTDKFVLAYDSDCPGLRSAEEDGNFLRSRGKSVQTRVPFRVKDWGNMYMNPILRSKMSVDFTFN